MRVPSIAEQYAARELPACGDLLEIDADNQGKPGN
jgi:hypothetical protein